MTSPPHPALPGFFTEPAGAAFLDTDTGDPLTHSSRTSASPLFQKGGPSISYPSFRHVKPGRDLLSAAPMTSCRRSGGEGPPSGSGAGGGRHRFFILGRPGDLALYEP